MENQKIDTTKPKNTTHKVDPVQEASEESFPASDAPAWITHEKKQKPKTEK